MEPSEETKALIGMPAWARDRIHVSTEVRLSWADRLHLLFSGQLWVRIEMDLQNHAGRQDARASIEIVRARWPWAKPLKDIPVEPEQPS